MMAFMAGNIKSLLAIKIKARHDSYSDQFSRIFAARMFVAASLVMEIDWFHDSVLYYSKRYQSRKRLRS